jgi:hypothetical protein
MITDQTHSVNPRKKHALSKANASAAAATTALVVTVWMEWPDVWDGFLFGGMSACVILLIILHITKK